MIDRVTFRERVQKAMERAPICYLAGPRQSGKTTLARMLLDPRHSAYFDLEDPEADSRLAALKAALNQDTPVTVIDEVQTRPDLFPALRYLADSPDRRTRYLILGSSSPAIQKGVAESLAGRVEIVELGGFGPDEIGMESMDRLRLRGGLPRSYLAGDDDSSMRWRKDFIALITARDLPLAGAGSNPAVLARFWTMMAHYHGQIWNAAEPARSLGLGETTIRRLVDIFEGLYHVRVLRPWHENLSKRQVKAPKLYIRDQGLLNALLGIATPGDLAAHPKCGAAWEGFVMEHLVRFLEPDEAWYWATHNGAELDLFLMKSGRRYGFEIKMTSNPSVTPSMRIANTDLGLERLWLVHPGSGTWPLADGMVATTLPDILSGTRGAMPDS